MSTQQEAVARFGPADHFARKFRLLLILSSLATICVGLWLVAVIAFILPSRDPDHIKMWGWITACFFAFSALTLLYLFRGPRSTWLQAVVMFTSVAAIAAGGYGLVNAFQVARSGGHFEGYIVLIGLVIGGHGVVALTYTLLVRRLARVVASS